MHVSLIQMNSVMDVTENLHQAKQYVREAAQKGARLIVLPEMFLCLGVKKQASLAQRFFAPGSTILKELKSLAQDLSIYIIAGSLPLPITNKSGEQQAVEKVYAGCLVFTPDGLISDQYNKMHLFDVDVDDEKGRYRESDTFLAGDKPVVSDIDGIKCGLSICYDVRFPDLYQYYQKHQCRLICVPSAFTFETGAAHWLTLLKARAIETQCYILAANQTGLHEDGRRTYGHSVVIDPWGQVVAELTHEPGVVCAQLDFTLQDNIQKKMPLSKHGHDFFRAH